jgi:hypothetical protein
MAKLVNNNEVDLKSLRTVDQLRGKIKELFTNEEILEMAEHLTIPFYTLTNPLTKKETILFNQDELVTHFWKCIRGFEPKLEQKLEFLYFNYEDRRVSTSDVVPPELTKIKNLYKLPIEGLATPPGVYFLCKDQEIVYIGQGINVSLRVINHLNEAVKEFDSAYFIPCYKEHLTNFESALIRKYKPKYNIHYIAECKEDDAKLLEALIA